MTHALVLLSGGVDSACCLAWARLAFDRVSCVTFDYGQRNRLEVEAARRIASIHECGTTVLGLGGLLGGSALTGEGDLNELKGGISMAFVPARNLLFLSAAAAHAGAIGADTLVAGITCRGGTGFPDCQPGFVEAMSAVLRESFRADEAVSLACPVLHMTKPRIIAWLLSMHGGEMALRSAVSCYEGKPQGCGACQACVARDSALEVNVAHLPRR